MYLTNVIDTRVRALMTYRYFNSSILQFYVMTNYNLGICNSNTPPSSAEEA